MLLRFLRCPDRDPIGFSRGNPSDALLRFRGTRNFDAAVGLKASEPIFRGILLGLDNLARVPPLAMAMVSARRAEGGGKRCS